MKRVAWAHSKGRRIHREIFLAFNGPGPWPCYGCGEGLTVWDLFDVHHLDENADNHHPDNLVPMHKTCHRKLKHANKRCPDGCTCARHTSLYVARTTPEQRSGIAARGRSTLRESKRERDMSIARSYLAGMSADEIADRWGITGRQVLWILNRDNIPTRTTWGSRRLYAGANLKRE